MPSDKVTRILLSKTDLMPEAVESMTEAQAWRFVYSLPKPKPDQRLEVCFTGFGVSEKAELCETAKRANLKVVKSVTKSLSLLVCGANAGPMKLERAGAQGVVLLDADEFRAFLGTGEIPDSPQT